MSVGAWRELLYALRQYRRSPGLAAGVALTIGLGVGANLAIVALLSDIFFPATPYRDSSRLAMVENTGPYFFGGRVPEGLPDARLSMPDFEGLRSGQRSLSSVGALSDGHVSVLTGTDRPRSVCRVFVSETFFETIGAAPLRGRLLGPGDFAAGAPPAALVTDGLWRTALASEPAATGRQVRLDEQPFTIVGIIPSSTFGLLRPREQLLDEGRFDRCVVTPLAPGSRGGSEMILEYQATQRDSPALRVLGRLRPAETVESAERDITALGSRISGQNTATSAKRGLRLVSLDTRRTAEVRPLLLMLAVAAGLAFLVACANAAGLVLTDTIGRQAELGLRQAIGASSAQLVGVVLTRAVLWSLPGALLGFLFAEATLAAIRWGASAGADRVAGVAFGPAVIGAGIALTILAGLATGSVAAWTLRRRHLVDALRESGQTTSGGRRSHRVTFGLVAVQVAAATALTFGAALLLHSMWNVVSADRGFDIDRGFVVQVRLPKSKYPKAADNADYFRRAFIGDADPLACTLKFGNTLLSIAGVIGDVHQETSQARRRPPQSVDSTGTAYMLYSRFGRAPSWSFLVVRAQGDPGRLAKAAIEELLLVDDAACLDDPRTFSQLFARRVAERRRILGLIGGFAGLVLLITALSLTSALAQFVATHTHDLAIRRALGASPARVLAFTSRHLALALGVGLAGGAAGSAWLGKALTSQLFGILPSDPPTIAAALAALAGLAVAAAAGPLWRAARVDPARALRAL